jgi:hypothetical protein
MGEQDRAEREKFENELKRILNASDSAGIILRVIGSLAFQMHCQKYGYLQAAMGRAYTDIDFAAYQKQTKEIQVLMAGLGYHENREVFIVSEGYRSIFEKPEAGLHIDVFFGKLDFCHVIHWDGRLEVDHPSIPLAEMLLEKMQIDWGLWRTTTMNLDKVRQMAQGYEQLTSEQKKKIDSQVKAALARIDQEPKSLAWRLRARVGDRVKWYKDVDEVQ